MLMRNMNSSIPENLRRKLLTLFDLQQQAFYNAMYLAEECSNSDAIDALLDKFIGMADRFNNTVCNDGYSLLSPEYEGILLNAHQAERQAS